MKIHSCRRDSPCYALSIPKGCVIVNQPHYMNDQLQRIIESSKAGADEIIKSTEQIRKSFAAGRPNTSQESTVEGTLAAFSVIVSGFDIGFGSTK